MSFSPGQIPVLETERLILRGLRTDDLDGICAIHADAERARFIGGYKDRGACWDRLLALLGHWQAFGWGRFAIEDKASGAFLGHCGPAVVSLAREPEMNYSLTPAAQGRGIAREAVHRALVFAFADLGWQTAVSLIHPENARSQAVAGRLGAIREGTVVTDKGERDAWRYPPAEIFLGRVAREGSREQYA